MSMMRFLSVSGIALGVGFWGFALREHGVRAVGVVAVEQGVDPLTGDVEVGGCFTDSVVLFADVANHGEIAVGAVHGFTLTRVV